MSARTSPGAAVDFTVRVGQTPISVGAALDYLRYGTETRRLSVFPSVPEVLNDVNTTNNFIRTHALVRVQPRAGRVRPYAEGLLGFSYAYTQTSVDLGYEGGSEGTTHLGDFAPSFGAGGGVTIGLASWSEGRLGLEIGLRYLTGGEVDYLTQGDLQRDASGVNVRADAVTGHVVRLPARRQRRLLNRTAGGLSGLDAPSR